MTPRRGLEKVVQLEVLALRVRELQHKGLSVAHCHGCFDILHAGHLRHLEQARGLADALVVTVTPDRFVGKGRDRPVFSDALRAELIGGLEVVDWVAINRWASAERTIALLRPDVFVKGAEYESEATNVNPNFLAEADAIRAIGGRVAFTGGLTLSSTAALDRLLRGAR
jgi:rfaE bifunctional protein nucleotidyltransferase chain/domain